MIKNTAIFILAVVIAILFYLNKSGNSRMSILEDTIGVMKSDSVTMWEVNDKLISERQSYDLTKDELGVLQEEVDKYKFELGIERVKNKNLRALVDAKIVSNGEGTVKIQIDTVYSSSTDSVYSDLKQSFTVADEYLKFDGYLMGDSLQYKYSYTDQIYLGVYNKKQGWFKPKVTTVVASMSNPNAKVTGLNSIVVHNPKPLLNLSIQAGYGVTSNGLSPYIGIGISKPLITIK